MSLLTLVIAAKILYEEKEKSRWGNTIGLRTQKLDKIQTLITSSPEPIIETTLAEQILKLSEDEVVLKSASLKNLVNILKICASRCLAENHSQRIASTEQMQTEINALKEENKKEFSHLASYEFYNLVLQEFIEGAQAVEKLKAEIIKKDLEIQTAVDLHTQEKNRLTASALRIEQDLHTADEEIGKLYVNYDKLRESLNNEISRHELQTDIAEDAKKKLAEKNAELIEEAISRSHAARLEKETLEKQLAEEKEQQEIRNSLFNEEISRYKLQIDMAEDASRELQEKNAELIEEVISRSTAARLEKERLEKQLAEEKEQREVRDSLFAAVEKEKSDYIADMSIITKKQIADLNKDIQTVIAHSNSKIASLNSQMQALTLTKDDTIASLTQQIAQLNSSRDSTVAELNQQITDLIRESDSSKQANSEEITELTLKKDQLIENHTREIAKFTRQQTEHEETIERLSARVGQLNSELAESVRKINSTTKEHKNVLQKMRDESKSEGEAHHESRKKLKDRIKQEESRTAAAKLAHEVEVKILKQEIQHLTHSSITAKEELDRITAQAKDNADKARTDHAQLRHKMRGLESTISENKASLAEKQAQIDAAKNSIARLEELGKSLQSTVHTLTEERDSLLSQIGELKSTIDAQAGEIDQISSTVEFLDQTTNGLQESLGKTTEERNALQQVNSEQRDVITSQTRQMHEYNDSVKTLRDDLQSLSVTFQAVTQERDSLLSKSSAQGTVITSQLNEIGELKKEKDLLKATLSSLSDQISKLRKTAEEKEKEKTSPPQAGRLFTPKPGAVKNASLKVVPGSSSPKRMGMAASSSK